MSDVIVSESKIHGVGVFAQRAFAKGETVLFIDDSRIVDEAYPLRPELGENDFHCDYLANGKIVLMQSPERHINSSCDPNTVAKTINGIRRAIALKSIKASEEITWDYIINCHGGIIWECHCRSVICRKTIPSSFFDLPQKTQLKLLPMLDDWFIEEHREKVDSLLK